jgi:hypothetical protein
VVWSVRQTPQGLTTNMGKVVLAQNLIKKRTFITEDGRKIKEDENPQEYRLYRSGKKK